MDGNTAQASMRAERAVLLAALVVFALLITVAKPALSAFIFDDLSVYVALILLLALVIWALTWFYMSRLDAEGPSQ